MMMMIPPIPPAQEPDEPATHYGSRLVVWLIAQDPAIGYLDDAQAERAHQATTEALTHRSVIDDQPTPACVYDRLEQLRRDLASSIRRRADDRAAALAQLTETPQSVYPTAGTQPGKGSPLTPPPPPLPPVGDTIGIPRAPVPLRADLDSLRKRVADAF